ncbi:MAG: MerR family DNA-binding protein [Gemmatimonadota bacterium]
MTLTIGAVAKQAGLGIQTVRFYEREGLIEAPPRSSSGYRAYDEKAVYRLRFIRRAQELGFTLKEIRELIALEQDQDADCEQVRGVASSKLSTVENKIADLQRMKAALQQLIHSCNGSGPIRDCVIMDCLQSSTECEVFSPRPIELA